jgi:hypothetical protein
MEACVHGATEHGSLEHEFLGASHSALACSSLRPEAWAAT